VANHFAGMIDHLQHAVYRAEDQWSALIDRGGPVDFFGSTIHAPVQMRFGSLEAVNRYVQHVCRSQAVDPPQIRHRKGGSRAHYANGVIAIPTHEPWAMRESVVLHEIAHHICISNAGVPLHDRHFTAAMLTLVQDNLGYEAELLLRTGYQAAGIPT
jgi:putative metallohydrolase (TIGR04338 family)